MLIVIQLGKNLYRKSSQTKTSTLDKSKSETKLLTN
jgi:hypothetical protein